MDTRARDKGRKRDNHYPPEKRKAYKTKWDAAHRVQHNIRSANYREANPDKIAETRMNCRHRITRAEHRWLMQMQDGRCALCSLKFEPYSVNRRAAAHTDHDHKCPSHPKEGGCVECIRGLLCPQCNQTVVPFLEIYPDRQIEAERQYLAGRPVLDYRSQFHLSGHPR